MEVSGGPLFITPPRYDTIIEPFTGSAGYSMRYPYKKVILVERDPKIAATWRYLLGATPSEIRSLPDIRIDQKVEDLNVHQEARWLIGWWVNKGAAQPMKSPSKWMRVKGNKDRFWSPTIRERIASQVEHIRHWKLIEGDYTDAPDIKATWFIDPPYQKAGIHYRFGSKLLDYEALGDWCKARKGQTMVCESVGAKWLPFQPWRDIKASPAKYGGKVSHGAIWTQDTPCVNVEQK